MSTRTEPHVETPRDRILRCAIDLFAIHGFEAMTMRLLGEAVGLDNSSLYRHFPSKSALAHAAIDHVAEDFLRALAGHDRPLEAASIGEIEDLAGAAAIYLFDNQAAARLLVHWLMNLGPSGAAFGISIPAGDKGRPAGELYALVNRRLGEGVRSGVLRKHATPEALIMLFGAILLRPATYGHLLASAEPRRSRTAARRAWEAEVRTAVRCFFTP